MSTILIQKATPKDAVGIAAVLKVTWVATYPNESQNIAIEDILHIPFNPPKSVDRWWVAKLGKRVVGACKGHDSHIQALYVCPSHQGMGIGRALLQAALAECTGKVYVEVASYNERAIKFYQANGFVLSSESVDGKGLPSGAQIPQVRLWRRM